ncbi:MAG: hypothetical protein MZV63_21535 [Marinilabiliales bacterium]|nr:hypothetical protein [Marinilabiliales bacterium]
MSMSDPDNPTNDPEIATLRRSGFHGYSTTTCMPGESANTRTGAFIAGLLDLHSFDGCQRQALPPWNPLQSKLYDYLP